MESSIRELHLIYVLYCTFEFVLVVFSYNYIQKIFKNLTEKRIFLSPVLARELKRNKKTKRFSSFITICMLFRNGVLSVEIIRGHSWPWSTIVLFLELIHVLLCITALTSSTQSRTYTLVSGSSILVYLVCHKISKLFYSGKL